MIAKVPCLLRLTYCRTHYIKALYFSSQAESINENKTEKVINKVVNVAIVGAPNSGKSTLINNIVQRKICAASNKVHTTTKLARAICVHNDTQVIFLDTPGVVTEKEQKRYKLPNSMISSCQKGLRCADVIGVVHDVSNKWHKDKIHHDVLTMLELAESIPCFLILNKVDQLKTKKHLLDVITNLTNGVIAGSPMQISGKNTTNNCKGYSKFSDVFLVSALNGDGVQDIKNYLVANAKTRSLHYQEDDWTDQTSESLIEDTVRAKFLDFLSQEIPYKLKVELEYFEDDNVEDKIICSVCVECPTDRLARLISGAGGGRLQQIKQFARSDLMDLFKKPVALNINLKVANNQKVEIFT